MKNKTQTKCEICRHYKPTCELFSEICKYEPIIHDDYTEAENDHLEARCLNCNNAKACKEKHWKGCMYEPKDKKTCEPQQKSCTTCEHSSTEKESDECYICSMYYNDNYVPQTEREGE